MGPVAAARPILRPGSTFLIKQLSGPALIPSRPIPAPTSFSSFSKPPRQLPICLQCKLQSQLRHYSTNPPSSSSPEHRRNPEEAVKDPPIAAASPSPSPSSPHEEAEAAAAAAAAAATAPELPSQADSRRSPLSHSFSAFMDNLQSRAFVASQTLNDLTGYSAIESIKAANARLEADLATAQETLRGARAHYKAVNARRAATQREVTALLARKDTWSPLDLERFTTLYRQDHELEAAVGEAGTALTEAEAEEARLSQSLNSGILRRYHEEQIWSDRIRRQSTWGTWGLMGVNVLLFLVLQFVAEPWKRSRLMKGIAAEEKAALEAVRRELEEVRGFLARRNEQEEEQQQVAAAAAAAAGVAAATATQGEAIAPESIVEDAGVEATPVSSLPRQTIETNLAPEAVSWKDFLLDPSLWRPALEDLYSERRIDLRMRDASIIALEGAVAGAAIVASVAFMTVRRA